MFNPHTDADRQAMLKEIGAGSIEDLFSNIPASYRFPKLDLPAALTEMEAWQEAYRFHNQNLPGTQMPNFLGAGVYRHYTPAIVDSILRRGEFFTAYTPYQPEISQGTLQAIFEFQTHIINLTGMDVSSASHYDGATAAAETVNMSQVIFRHKRSKVVLSPSLHPHYRQTIHTYFNNSGIEFVGEDLDPNTGQEALAALIDQDTALVLVQYPDFFGRISDFSALGKTAHEAGALLGMAVNPLSLSLLKPPADFGADIVCGEGQSLGVPLSYGGPYLGILATKQEYIRSIAGRLVGETVDADGQRGYVLTLSTREQHIKRERASSNICSNQGLVALATTIYMTALGKEGLREVGELNYHNAHYAAEQINALNGYTLWSDAPFFNEFVVTCPKPAAEVNQALLQAGIIGGYDLGQDYPGLENQLMLAVTEANSKKQIDKLVSALAEVAK